jgi:hypothetical protein
VHGCRFGKANRATYEPLDPSPQIDVFALDGLRVLFTDDVLLRDEMPLVRPPSIGIETRDPKRLQQGLQLQKDSILALSKDLPQHLPTVMINRVPQPPRVRFLADITPHLIEFCRQPAPLFQLFSSTNRHLHPLRMLLTVTLRDSPVAGQVPFF